MNDIARAGTLISFNCCDNDCSPMMFYVIDDFNPVDEFWVFIDRFHEDAAQAPATDLFAHHLISIGLIEMIEIGNFFMGIPTPRFYGNVLLSMDNC